MTGCPYAAAAAAEARATGVDARTRGERDSEWAPALDETFGSAHTDYARLRTDNPFPWSEEFGGFWAATTYEDVVSVTQDERFITSVQNVVPHVPRSSRRPPLHFDPPEHTAYREAIDPVLRRSIVARHEPEFRASADELVSGMIATGRADGVADFAAPFVVDCFASYLGVTAELARRIRDIGVRYGFAIQDMDDPVIAECSAELYEIAEDVYRRRLAEEPDPTTDLVASLHAAALDSSNHITERTAIATIRQMIVAGMAAPQAVLGSCIVHLAQDDELQSHLREHPEDLPAAIEEFLRLHAPYRVFARTPREDLVVHGRLVREREPIALVFPSANRDPEVFDDPDTFVLHRKNNSHLAFGRGAHRCPAATLGRLELLVALETLLARTRSFSLAGEVEMMNWLEYGPRSVPLRVEAR
ncbi:cytochrome P450 [Microbacterium sp. ET2]|uniref:cytochrome P450 n=1 Tax=Microbacterium albipurpureum TaxID=3050384 RepID=UPI00259CB328|nr:cytochrome P450 [Microbacterium sp. ET2 (Ac-2212)]WJL94692.1 cytochrome P450 [Microbacterium sp. ET2 (Ac-2212)]